jgi:hypothetical protein
MFAQEAAVINLMTVLDKQNGIAMMTYLGRQAQFGVLPDEPAAGVPSHLLTSCVMAVLKQTGGHSPSMEHSE